MKYPKFWIYIIVAIVVTMIALCLASCHDYEKEENTVKEYHMFVETIRGHDYVVTTIRQGYGCGVSVVHAESCKCKESR